MAATFKVRNQFSVEIDGITYTGKHGESTDDGDDFYEYSITGNAHVVPGTLATAAVATVYDDDDDVPADWDYLFFWAAADMYIQIIGPTMHAIFKVESFLPFVLPGFDSMVAAANSTAITGGTEPTMSDIDSIVIGNYSGASAKYLFALFD